MTKYLKATRKKMDDVISTTMKTPSGKRQNSLESLGTLETAQGNPPGNPNWLKSKCSDT